MVTWWPAQVEQRVKSKLHSWWQVLGDFSRTRGLFIGGKAVGLSWIKGFFSHPEDSHKEGEASDSSDASPVTRPFYVSDACANGMPVRSVRDMLTIPRPLHIELPEQPWSCCREPWRGNSLGNSGFRMFPTLLCQTLGEETVDGRNPPDGWRLVKEACLKYCNWNSIRHDSEWNLQLPLQHRAK